jgi:hypothetical protein
MAKKVLVILALFVFVAGVSFARPNNTLTVDFGPTLVGAALGAAGGIIGNFMEDDEDVNFDTSGFGIAVQYERQINPFFSVAGRFAYLAFGMGMTAREGLVNATVDTDFTSYSIEGHARLYPFTGSFFLDGMLGYGNLSTKFDGNVIATGLGSQAVSSTVTRNYIKAGGKLGWRIDPGRPGGFVLEIAFGYYHAIGLGDSIMTQLAREVGGTIQGIGDELELIENFVFIGGPRATLALGWRF